MKGNMQTLKGHFPYFSSAKANQNQRTIFSRLYEMQLEHILGHYILSEHTTYFNSDA